MAHARIDAASLSTLLDLADAERVDHDTGWELWTYKLRDPASQRLVAEGRCFLFIKARGPSIDSLPEIATRVAPIAATRPLTLILGRSSTLLREQSRVKGVLGAQGIFTTSEILAAQCRRLLGVQQNEVFSVSHFVEPSVAGEDALGLLTAWLNGQVNNTKTPGKGQSDAPEIAVLLAPPGVGKTSVSRELARSLAFQKGGAIPVLLESSQWRDLPRPLSLWKLIECALLAHGYDVPRRERFELLMQAGCVALILDGLDEVASIRSKVHGSAGSLGELTPLDILSELRELSSDTDCRILLTSRDGLWSELIPEQERATVAEFTLEPFSKQHIAQYRERRFPRPGPIRDRYDELLKRLNAVIYPDGTGLVPQAERAAATPLVLHLLATEAEEDTRNEGDALDFAFQEEYRSGHPLYVITHGVLKREHDRRGLSLNPSEQFAMMAHLLDFDAQSYSFDEIEVAATVAAKTLSDHDRLLLRAGHPLLKAHGDGKSYSFRYGFLAEFAPAVWIAEHLRRALPDTHCLRQLESCAGRSSPILGHVADLIREEDWKTWLRGYWTSNVAARTGAASAALWELAQGLLGSGPTTRVNTMLELFGTRDGQGGTFKGCTLIGPVVNLDLTSITFAECKFRDVIWIDCGVDASTTFRSCWYAGRFDHVRTSLRLAQQEGLSAERMDATARSAIEAIWGRGRPAPVSTALATQTLTSLLEPFKVGAFFVPKGRDVIASHVLAHPMLCEKAITSALSRHVLLKDDQDLLRIEKKHQQAVASLLDNGILSGRLVDIVNDLLREFSHDDKK